MRNQKLMLVGLLIVLAFFQGVAQEGAAPREVLTPLGLAFALVEAALIFFWYRVDSIERGYRRTALLSTMIVAVSLLALPWYFFHSRGFLRGLQATGVFLALIVACFGLTWAGELAVHYAQGR
jgi:hypothetical protein